MKTAIVVGATGLIGSTLLHQLLADDRYARVKTPVRKSTGRQNAKLEEHVVDFDRLADYPDAFTGDELFVCLGTTLKTAGSAEARRRVDRDLVIAVAEAAQGRVKRIAVVSSVGADAASGNAYLRDKGEMEAAVAAMDYEKVVLVQPSFFYGNRKENRFGERIGIAVAQLLGSLLGKYEALPAGKVAAAMVKQLNQPSGKVVRVGVGEMKKVAG
ncbi:MAG: NAD(P)H-binding protein [Cytophagales bacterium]|jgi:uncharacterized protein YbjT (DUF2867 family)|nr:NAD(P)H-binding protein [Cytophagales bacterium]